MGDKGPIEYLSMHKLLREIGVACRERSPALQPLISHKDSKTLLLYLGFSLLSNRVSCTRLFLRPFIALDISDDLDVLTPARGA